MSASHKFNAPVRRYVETMGIKFYEYDKRPGCYFVPGEQIWSRDQLQAWATERGEVLTDGEEVV